MVCVVACAQMHYCHMLVTYFNYIGPITYETRTWHTYIDSLSTSDVLTSVHNQDNPLIPMG